MTDRTGATVMDVLAVTPSERPPAHSPTRPPAQRLLSLDVFRGLTIAAMLLVNNPGTWTAIYAPLKHAPWHGWTPTDLIFPFFLFIVGVAMTFSFARALGRGASRRDLLLKAAKRAALIFLVGLLLHGFPNYISALPTLRIPGVLQRIAIAFLAATVIVLYTGVRGIVIAVATLLLGYWALEMLVPVPGGFTGVLEPGRDLGAYIDRAVFGTAHLWSNSKTWDPEGLLSTLPAIGTTLAGVLAGYWIRSARTPVDKTVGLFLAGNVGLLAGIIWNEVFPINKNLWTSSYVVFTAGMACHGLAMCYYLVDVKGQRWWTKPFVIFGMNAIAAFFLSGIGARLLGLIKVTAASGQTVSLKAWLFETLYASWLAPVNASLAFAITYVLFWLGVMTILYHKRIFIKL